MADYTPYKHRKGVCNEDCKGCVFLGYATGDISLCEYLLRTGKRRPCPAGTGCTVKQVGDRGKAWREERDETWKAKQQWKKKPKSKKEAFHNQCQVCGKIFETTRQWQRYCCTDCANKAKIEKNRKWHQEHKVESPILHRSCPECGTEFDTTNKKKVFCCKKCAVKHKQREYYRKEKEDGNHLP